MTAPRQPDSENKSRPIYITAWDVLGEIGELALTGLCMVRRIGTISAVQSCLSGYTEDPIGVVPTMSTEHQEWKYILTVFEKPGAGLSKTHLEKNIERGDNMGVKPFVGNLDHRDAKTRNAIGKDDKSQKTWSPRDDRQNELQDNAYGTSQYKLVEDNTPTCTARCQGKKITMLVVTLSSLGSPLLRTERRPKPLK